MPRYIVRAPDEVDVASGSGTTNRLMRFDSSDDAADGSLLDDGSGALKQPGAATDVAPTVTSLIGAHAYAQASSNTTGAVLRLAPGIGRRFITVDDYAQAGTGTVTVTVNGTATVLTAGTDFTAATSNAVTATNLATAIEAIAGVSATASSAVVYVTPDDSTYTLTLARSVAAFATVTSGADGNLTLASGQLLLPDGTAGAPSVARSAAPTVTGLLFDASVVGVSTDGTERYRFNDTHFVIRTGQQIGWTSGTITSANDTGLKRAAAGAAAITDGSTGVGDLGTATARGAANAYLSTSLLVNTTAATGLHADITDVMGYAPALGVVANGTYPQMALVGNAANANAAYLYALKTRSATGSDADTAVASGDDVMSLRAFAADGAAYRETSRILQEVGTYTGADNVSGRVAILTRPTGASGTLAERFSVEADGSSSFKDGTNGKSLNVKLLTELTTIAAAATTDTTIEIPANATVLAVSVRVTTVIPTAATFTVTGATSSTTFHTGASVSAAADTTNPGNAAGAYYNATAQKIRITPNLTPGDTTGRVRVTIHYIDITPPTS